MEMGEDPGKRVGEAEVLDNGEGPKTDKAAAEPAPPPPTPRPGVEESVVAEMAWRKFMANPPRTPDPLAPPEGRREEKKKRAKEDGPAYAADFPGLVDIVEREGEAAFLVKKNGKVEVVSEHEGLLPPPTVPWLLPRATEVLRYIEEDNDARLFDDLVEWHRSAADLPPEVYPTMAAFDFHTHFLEPANFSPEFIFEAAPERGKSRAGKSMTFVARRGIVVESLRDPYLIRAANDMGATLFFDVRDIWKKAEKTGTEDILLHRFERGATVPRVVYPDRGPFKDTLYYAIFGPTIIGTNETPDGLLDSRGYTIRPPDSTKKFDNEITKEAGLPLRERLVAFRARHLGEPLPPAAKPAPGRLGDISRPLLQIIRLVRPEREADILTFLQGQQLARTAGRRESFEGRVLAAVLRLAGKVADGKLATKEITEEVNRGVPERWQTTAAKVGRTLWHLGFERGSTHTSGSALLWNTDLLRRLAEKYGIPPTPLENPPIPPIPPNPPKEDPKPPMGEREGKAGGSECSDGSEGSPGGHGGVSHTRPPVEDGEEARLLAAVRALQPPTPSRDGVRLLDAARKAGLPAGKALETALSLERSGRLECVGVLGYAEGRLYRVPDEEAP